MFGEGEGKAEKGLFDKFAENGAEDSAKAAIRSQVFANITDSQAARNISFFNAFLS